MDFGFHSCALLIFLSSLFLSPSFAFADQIQIDASIQYVSAIGDPGMRNSNVRVALEAWNFCNEVGIEAPNMGSPRLADCADLYCPLIAGNSIFFSDSLFHSIVCQIIKHDTILSVSLTMGSDVRKMWEREESNYRK